MKRRKFLFLSSIGLLAGCQTTTPSSERKVDGSGLNSAQPASSDTASNVRPSPSTIHPNKVLTPEMTTDFRVVDVTLGFTDDFKQNPNGAQYPDAQMRASLQRYTGAYLNT